MIRIVKFGGLSLVTGVVIGLGVVGWLWLHRPASATVNSQGGSVSLSDAPNATGSTDSGDLKVAQPVNGGVGSVLGSAADGSNSSAAGGGSNGVASGDSNSAGSGTGSSNVAASLPGPDEFGQYEQYRNNQGALYGDVRSGTGDEVKAGSVVTVNYQGWLTNGKLFDESYSKGQPFTFTEGGNQVISGWEQGLMGMKVGGKRRLIVPPAYGYGADAHDPIPANSVLVFDIELVSVVNK